MLRDIDKCNFADGRCSNHYLLDAVGERDKKIVAFIDAAIDYVEDRFEDEAIRQLGQAKKILMGKAT